MQQKRKQIRHIFQFIICEDLGKPLLLFLFKKILLFAYVKR